MTSLRERRGFCTAAVLLVACSGLLLAGNVDCRAHHKGRLTQSLSGIYDSNLSAEQAEKLFLSVPDPESAKRVSRAWTAKPHPAGSPNDYDSAVELLSTFQAHLGIKPAKHSVIFEAGSVKSRQATLSIPKRTAPFAWIDTYHPLLDTPGERKLEILDDDGSVLWTADLEEKFEKGDPAGKWHKSTKAWHALSKSGDVQGKLVYVGYGRKKEFDELVAAGHNLTGKIALVRDGGVFRGLKVKAAQEAGAVGCIEYKDRHWHAATIENGYKPWPKGPGFNPDSVERGSVQFLSLYPGDPTTPGTPSYRDAKRTEPLSIPSIPSLPISYNNGKVLLKLFEDKSAVFSNRDVRLVNKVHQKFTPIWNTMAVIPGRIRDEIVVIGNHRDAWVLGAGDPTSGTVTIHEITRGLGALIKKGWQPLRTIIIASWDAEEYGLIGSTEWGEDFPDFIQKHVVAYMNVDSSAAGERYLLRGSPTLANLLQQAAEELPHPTDHNRTLWDARLDTGHLFANKSLSPRRKTENAPENEIGMLGSGSDYTVFLQRLGVASMDESFRAGRNSPVWHRHSVWDSEHWMETYGDPGFFKHVAVAKHMGLVLLRLTSQPLLPFNTTQYAMDLDDFLNDVARQEHTPDLTDLASAIKNLQSASTILDKRKAQAMIRLEAALTRRAHADRSMGECDALGRGLWSLKLMLPFSGITPSPSIGTPSVSCELEDVFSEIRSINKILSTFEQGFLSEKGLPGREWYRHLGVAPGRWRGYGKATFPALTEAITLDKNSTLASYEAQRLTNLIEKLARELDS